MTRQTLSTLLAIATAGCGVVPAMQADPGDQAPETLAASPDAAGFETLPLPSEIFASPLAIADHFAYYRPESEGQQRFDLMSRRTQRPGVFELFFTSQGQADDSVSGQRWRVLVEPAGNGWRAIEAGMQARCVRGPRAGEWVKGLCP